MPLLVGGAASVFGVATVAASGSVLLGGVDAGHVVPFVLWFNFLAGFCYVAAGLGIVRSRRWAATLSVLIALATALVAVAFAVHVAWGGAFEPRTAGALLLRTSVWSLVAAVTARRFTRRGARDPRGVRAGSR